MRSCLPPKLNEGLSYERRPPLPSVEMRMNPATIAPMRIHPDELPPPSPDDSGAGAAGATSGLFRAGNASKGSVMATLFRSPAETPVQTHSIRFASVLKRVG